MQVRCLQCHEPFDVPQDSGLAALTCSSCGSTFSLVGEETISTNRAEVQSIGHFELLERVGAGSFGTVWMARDTELDRVVAVKIPRKGQLDAEESEQFLREARAAAQLQHANIVSVHEVGREGESVFIVSDFIRGATLDGWLAKGQVTPREAAELSAKIAEALHHAHEAGVVHRDLKPSNIMIDVESQPYIMDFGLAKREAGEITMTVAGRLLGTPAYMSPEQARGEAHQADRRSDVYSLGVILFRLLTGELPFRGNVRMLVNKIITDEPASPRRLDSRVPRDLETICLKCLEKSPARRYQTAAELAAELHRWLAGEPIVARPLSGPERAWRWCRRKPAVAGLTATVASLLTVVAVVSALSAMRLGRMAERERKSAAHANTAASKERDARTAAERAQKNEAAARTRAETLAEETGQRLVRSYVDQGVQLMDGGDLMESLVWFAEALKLDEGHPAREDVHRTRIAAVLRRCPKLAQVWFHAGDVYSAEFSADGRLVVTSSADNTARVWDAFTGQPLTPPLRHNRRVSHASFSRDGRHVVTASDDNTAQVWEVATGRPIGARLRHRGAVNRAFFSPDGSCVVTASSDHTARVWNAATGEPLTPPMEHTIGVRHVEFSRDGRYVVTASGGRTPSGGAGWARVWNVATGEPVTPPVSFAVHHAAFSPDARRFVTAGPGGARVWDAATGNPVTPVFKHAGDVHYACFSPDGRQVVTGAEDALARVWDVGSGHLLAKLQHGSAVRYASFSPDGARVVTASDDGTARVWDAGTGDPLTAPLRHGGVVYCAHFSSDGRRVLTSSRDGTARLWDTATGQPVHAPLKHRPGSVARQVAFSHDSRYVLTRDFEGMRVWDVETGKPVTSPLRGEVYASLSRDGRFVTATSHDHKARVWDVATGRLLATFQHYGSAGLTCFSPDGRYVLTVSGASAYVWDVATGKLVRRLEHGALLWEAFFGPDGEYVVTASTADRTVKVWDVATGRPVTPPPKKRLAAGHATLSPDARRMVYADGKTARVWDLVTGKEISALQHNGLVTSALFDPEGERVVTTSTDQTARTWDVDSGRPLAPPMRHGGTTVSGTAAPNAAFSPNGRYIFTTSSAGAARVWDALSGQPVTPLLRHQNVVWHAAFSPDGRHLVTGGWDETSRVWDLAPDERPTADLILMGQLLSGHRIDVTGGLVPLDSSRLRKAWETLRDSYPDDFVCSTEEVLAWHRRLANRFEQQERWGHVIGQLDSVTPRHWSDHVTAGRAHAELAQWNQAATEYAAAVKLSPGDEMMWYHLALSRIAAGDIAGYRKTCNDVLERFHGTERPFAAHLAAWTCVLTPDSVADGSKLVAAAQGALLPKISNPVVDPTNLDFEAGVEEKFVPKGWRTGGRASYGSNYDVSIDSDVTHRGSSSVHIRHVAPGASSFGSLAQRICAEPYRRKRLRLSGFLRTEGVTGAAGLWMRVEGVHGILALANMLTRNLKGTTDWKQYEIVLDVDEFATQIYFGVILSGKGTVWGDDLSLEVVGPEIPTSATYHGEIPHRYLSTLGAALYRAGKFDAAVEKFQRSMKAYGGEGDVLDRLFMAMAHHRLGHVDEASQWLAKADGGMGRNLEEVAGGAEPYWTDRLERQLLLREARALINGASEPASR